MCIQFTRSVILKRMAKSLEEEADVNGDTVRGKDVLQRMIESEDPETGEKLDIDQLIAESIVQLWVKVDVSWVVWSR